MTPNTATTAFIHDHRLDDVATLALRGSVSADVDMPFALSQIEGWQTARRKLPSWATCQGVVYPPRLSMEQCSSEQSARYKVSIVSRLQRDGQCGVDRMVDLTGGFGVDFSFISPLFSEKVYVERQEQLCRVADNNMPRLGISNVFVVNADATVYLPTMPQASLIYLDPARRDQSGRRTYSIADCQPDVSALAPLLLQKAGCVLVKLSPMLDWHEAVREVPSVAEVHIVAVAGEVKELLLVLLRGYESAPKLYCADDAGVVNPVEGVPASGCATGPFSHLYEPNTALMKSGCFGWIASTYGVRPISANSHLFVSTRQVPHFPGRRFMVEAVSSLSKADIKRALGSVGHANVAVRNFPMTAAQLRRRLRLSDGGDVYIFGTTTADGRHVVIVCRKDQG